jgi:hypothetical protein
LALEASDFAYRGAYDVRTFGNDTTYMRALTHRYVNGQLRFLSLTHTGMLHEFALPAQFGQVQTARTGTWNLSSLAADFQGIWWEESQRRLWVTSTVDYGIASTFYPTRISTLTLGPDGAVTDLKTVSLQGINSKRVYGGVTPVPVWFQSKHGVGPYAVGFGGYTSLMAQASRASLGPELICIPDPRQFADGDQIPASRIRVLLDTDLDNRGVRKTTPLNYFDGGGANGAAAANSLTITRPTLPPDPSGKWLSPNQQGLGWMVWGDSYYNTGMWIDGPNKQGFAAIASLGKGACWYASSSLQFDDRQFELHIWDSNTLTNGLTTRPTSMTELLLPRQMSPLTYSGNVTACNISGATYDPVTSRVYAVGYPLGADGYTGRIFVYDVHA